MILKPVTVGLCRSCCRPAGVGIISPSASWTSRPSLGLGQSIPSSCNEAHYFSTASDRHHRRRSSARRQPPHPWPTCANPTPYDILNLRRGDPYSKALFVQLVKIYHPDRHLGSLSASSSPLGALSPAVRLERYRLVVLAHEILSDPYKRRAYDVLGAGWTAGHAGARPTRETLRRADRSWRHEPGSAARNATWEDWQRWHDAREGREPQRPVYMSNAGFVALVLAFVAVGGVAQASRAGSQSSRVVEVTQGKHAAITEDMMRRASASAGQTPTDRVDTFLRERENAAYSFSPEKYDSIVSRPK